MGVPKTSDHIQIKIKMPNSSWEPLASSTSPNQDLKDMLFFAPSNSRKRAKIWITVVKNQWPHPNQDQDAKPQIRTSSILQIQKWWLTGHGCSLHLQNQDMEQNFRKLVYQRPLTISKLRSRCQTPVRNLQWPPKHQMRTLRTWMFFEPSKSGERVKIWIIGVSKTSDYIKFKIKVPNPS